MDRAKKLATMASRIRRAAAAEDWRQVATLDREISALLPQLPHSSGWETTDVDALEKLRKVHAEVREDCASALERLGAHLAEQRDRHGGWIAYALNDSEERT